MWEYWGTWLLIGWVVFALSLPSGSVVMWSLNLIVLGIQGVRLVEHHMARDRVQAERERTEHE